jgi:glucose-1-phosphate cytidylyltransferase
MKVVLFCGGLGSRMGGYAVDLPKPLVLLKDRPILCHLMAYYAGWGHRDFIICLGHKGEQIRRYFTDGACPEAMSGEWNVTCVDTGLDSSIGDRLAKVAHHIGEEPLFLANYADGLTDFPLPRLVERVRQSGAVAGMLAVAPSQSFHFVDLAADGTIERLVGMAEAGLRVNGGFFVMRREIFDYLRPGEEMVEQPFRRLIAERRLVSIPYDGFWGCVDTAKDLKVLEAWFDKGDAAPQIAPRRRSTDSVGDRR